MSDHQGDGKAASADLTARELLQRAWSLHQAGRLEDARTVYQAALTLDPGQGDALHMLGLIAYAQGRPDEAADLLQRAAAAQEHNAQVWSNLGLARQAQGRSKDALDCYDRCLALTPDSPEALLNRGITLKALGRLDEALASYDRSLGLRPDMAPALFNRGVALQEAGRLEEALAAYDRARAVRRNHPATLANRGHVLRQLARLLEAESSYRAALQQAPNHATYHWGLGQVLADGGQPDAALAAFGQALRLDPAHAEALASRGLLQFAMGRFQEALADLNRAIVLQASRAELRVNRGSLLLRLGDPLAAMQDFQAAVQLAPNLPQGHYNLGLALEAQGRLEEAVHAFSACLDLRPDHGGALSSCLHVSARLCDWPAAERLADRLPTLIAADAPGLLPFPLLAVPDVTASQQLRVARAYAQQWTERAGPPLIAAHVPRSRAVGRLRVGYLSADFRDHATAHLLTGILEHHDTEALEVVLYSHGGAAGDAWNARIRAAGHPYRELDELDDAAAARLIAEDHLDLLVDLKGYTKDYRGGILARRPAPVLISWLGYPGTLGDMRLADYLIGDPVVTPLAHAHHYSETLALLPFCYQPNDNRRPVGLRPDRPEAGLPSDALVFCCFNQYYKIDASTFALWCGLLRHVPNSVLWLLAGPPLAMERLRHAASSHGIDPDRLVFAEHRPVAEHLARLQLADLALDTYPCASHTTASDALWAGVPLVTRIGETFASRVAASLLTAVGLPELVTPDEAAYGDLPVTLARDRARLTELRDRLGAFRDTSPLFDTAGFTHDLERLYRAMADQQARQLRRPIVLTPERPQSAH